MHWEALPRSYCVVHAKSQLISYAYRNYCRNIALGKVVSYFLITAMETIFRKPLLGLPLSNIQTLCLL